MSSRRATLTFNQALRGVAADAPSPEGGAGVPKGLRSAKRELGRKEAELAGREAALAAKEAALEEQMGRLAALIGAMGQQKAEMLAGAEEEIVSFSLTISEKVLQHEIENGRYKMAAIVESALQAVRDRGALVIRVNPRDHQAVVDAIGRIETTFGADRITAVADEAVAPASCCVEADSGRVLSDVSERLRRIEQALLSRGEGADGL